MRVTIDARAAVFPERTGVGTYVRQMLRWLPRVDPEDRFTAWYLNARGLLGGPRRFLREVEAGNLRERWVPIPARWFETASERWELPRLEWLTRFDVLFAPNFVPPPTGTGRLVLTVHDLAFKRFPETAPQTTRWWLRRLDRAVARAARILVPSEATRRDLTELLGVDPGRVAVTPLAVDPAVYRPAPAAEVERVRRVFGLAGPFILFVGGIEPRKNLARLVESFGRLPADLDVGLVLAGGGVAWNPEGRGELDAALRSLPDPIAARVVRTGYVDEADKVALLTAAEVLAYPSRYEGFGLPVLEAMACGTPVLTSDSSALPEVAGDAAVMVDPEDADRIAEGLERVIRDGELRERLRAAGERRAAGYRWEDTARRTAEVLREVGDGPGATRRG